MNASDLEALRAMVGREVTYRAPDALSDASGRYFARAVGDDNPLYRRAEGPIVPPTLIFETTQIADSPPNADGYAGHSWPIEFPGTRLLRGGHRYTWHRDVRPDDVITSTWRLDAVVERSTAAGNPMVVVTSTCRYSDERGDVIAENEETLLFVAATS